MKDDNNTAISGTISIEDKDCPVVKERRNKVRLRKSYESDEISWNDLRDEVSKYP